MIKRSAKWIAIIGSLCIGLWLGRRVNYEIVNIYVAESATKEDRFSVFWHQSPRIVDADTVTFQGLERLRGPIFRVHKGKIERLSHRSTSESETPASSYAVVGEKCYYPIGGLGQRLMAFENGKESMVPGPDGQYSFLDSDGKLLAFCDFHVAVGTYENGKFERLLNREGLDGEQVQQILVDRGTVYVSTRDSILTKADGKVVTKGDQLPGGVLDSVKAISVADGVVVFIGGIKHLESLPNALYMKKNGEFALIAPGQVGSRHETGFSHQTTNLCTNGDAIGVIESFLAKDLKLGKVASFPSETYDRLAVYHEGKKHIVTQVGDVLFGEVLVKIAVGPRGMDSQGNVAFSYRLDNSDIGIAIAKPRTPNAIYSYLCFAVAIVGLLWEWINWIKAWRSRSIPPVAPDGHLRLGEASLS